MFHVIHLLSVLEGEDDREVTMTSSDSYISMLGYEGSYNLNISVQIRTWQVEGVLVRHKFSSQGSLTISLNKGVDQAVVASVEGDIVLEYHDTPTSDGEWHTVEFFISRRLVGLTIDGGDIVKDSLPALIRTGGCC